MRERISSILNPRLFYVIFSVIASIVLWAYVGYGANNDEEVRVNNVPIQFTGAEELTQNDLVVTRRSLSSLNLRFSGKRNTVMKLNRTNITAVVDLSDILSYSTSTGAYQLNYQIQYPSGISEDAVSVSYASADYVTVTVEKLTTKEIRIEAIYDGGPADGFSAEPVVLSSDTMTVSGPDSLVSQVEKAQARFTAYDFSSTVIQEVGVTLLDAEGTAMDTEELNCSLESVTVTIPVVMVKEVRLDVNFTASNFANSNNLVYRLEPDTITLSGDADILRDINVINLGTVDLGSFGQSTSDTLAIRIPNGVRNLTGVSTAALTVEIKDAYIARLSVSSSNITYRNETQGLYYRIVSRSLDVTLRGSAASVSAVEENNVRIVADLSELGNTTGIFSVGARVSVDGYADMDPIGNYQVTIEVSNEPFAVEEEDTEEQEQQP